MREFIQQADHIGNTLACAGMGLEAISNLLGADGAEHHINAKDMSGLHPAIAALGSLISAAGFDLCGAAEAAREGVQQ